MRRIYCNAEGARALSHSGPKNVCAPVQAASYTFYLHIIPNNKKHNAMKFNKEFTDNQETFMKIEFEETGGNND